MSAELIGQPAVEPVSLAEAKLFLRLSGEAEDEIVAALILGARLAVEQLSRRMLIAQTWRARFDALPKSGLLVLPVAPLIEVEAVTVADGEGGAVTVPAGDYEVDRGGAVPRIAFAVPLRPGTRLGGIEVTFRAGYGETATDVPEPLRQAVRLLLAHWFENRGDVAGAGIPEMVLALVRPYRSLRIAA